MKSAASRGRTTTYILLLLPALVLFSVFFLWPFLRSVLISFTDAYSYRREIRWIGIGNYVAAFNSPYFLDSLWVTMQYTVFVTVFANITALLFALLLDENPKFGKTLRTVYFLPNLMSLIIVGFVWVFLYGDVWSALLSVLQIPKTYYISWLGNQSLAIYAIGITAIWQCAGYYMLIYIAALGNIPHDLREAAAIDGASRRQVLWNIKLPLLKPTFFMNTILLLTVNLKAFDYPMAMTSGGPAGATTTIALMIYNTGFRSNRTGYATAQSMILFVCIAALTAIIQLRQIRNEGKA